MSITERIRRAEELFASQIEHALDVLLKSERSMDDYDLFIVTTSRANRCAKIRIVGLDGEEREQYKEYCNRISETEGKILFSAWDKLSVKVQSEWIALRSEREQQNFNEIHNKKGTLNLASSVKETIKPYPSQTLKERYNECRARADRFEQLLEGKNPIIAHARELGKRVYQLTPDEYKDACENYKIIELQRDACYKTLYEVECRLKNSQKVVDKTNI